MDARCLQELEIWILQCHPQGSSPAQSFPETIILCFQTCPLNYIIDGSLNLGGTYFLVFSPLEQSLPFPITLVADSGSPKEVTTFFSPLLMRCHSGIWWDQSIRLQRYFQGLFVSIFFPFGSWLQLFDLKIKILHLVMLKSGKIQCLSLLQRHWFTVTFIIVLSFPLYCAPLSLR